MAPARPGRRRARRSCRAKRSSFLFRPGRSWRGSPPTAWPARRATTRATSGAVATCWRREVIEHAKQVAVRVFGRELVQPPGLRLRPGDQLCLATIPRFVQFVDFCFAADIEPGQHWTNIAVLLSIVR